MSNIEYDTTVDTAIAQFRHLLSLVREPDNGPDDFRLPDQYEAWTNSQGTYYSISRCGTTICGGLQHTVTERTYEQLLTRFTDPEWLATHEMNKESSTRDVAP